MAPKRKAANAKEVEARRCLSILDVISFTSLEQRLDKPELLPEYKKFLALKVAANDFDAALLSPPAEIDVIWHAHILDTAHYRTTCDALMQGCFIDHNPNGGADASARDARRRACVEDYNKAFGVQRVCGCPPCSKLHARHRKR